MSRHPRYHAEGIAMARLRCAYGNRRHFNSLTVLLHELGKFCFKDRNDGIFSTTILRFLPLASHPRTVLYSHFPALVDCGAVESCDGVDQFRIVGFLDNNRSAEEMAELDTFRREDMRNAKRRERVKRAALLESTQAVKAQLQENWDSRQIEAVAAQRHPQPTKPTFPEADVSATNCTNAAETPGNLGVPSKLGDTRPPLLSPSLAAAIQRAEMGAQRYRRSQQQSMPQSEITSVEQELTGKSHPVLQSSESARASAFKYPVRLARKPKARTPITENAMEEALEGLKTSLPRQTMEAWWVDMVTLGACAEDLGHAVFSVKHQREKKGQVIRNPVAYARRIVTAQVRARQGLFT